MSTKEIHKQIRNNLLVQSDYIIKELYDDVQINRWVKYRQQLRTFFDNLPDNYNYSSIVWPRTPNDIDALYQLAAEGDAEAAKIIKKDKL